MQRELSGIGTDTPKPAICRNVESDASCHPLLFTRIVMLHSHLAYWENRRQHPARDAQCMLPQNFAERIAHEL